MKILVSLLCTLAVAGPAAAQAVETTAVLDRAAPEARALFAVEAGGLRHVASGFRCPGLESGLTLTGVTAGAFAGAPASQAAYCEYSDVTGPVARLAFSKDAPSEPVLDRGFCRNLPKVLKLPDSAGELLGMTAFEGPKVSAGIASLPVRGKPQPLWICDWSHAPFQAPVVIANVAALRAEDGWTARAIHTPAPPPCCRGYRNPVPMTFYFLPTLLVGDAVDARPANAAPAG